MYLLCMYMRVNKRTLGQTYTELKHGTFQIKNNHNNKTPISVTVDILNICVIANIYVY